jgi:hypothetical protein
MLAYTYTYIGKKDLKTIDETAPLILGVSIEKRLRPHHSRNIS